MGKKRVIKKTAEEILKEGKDVEKALSKDTIKRAKVGKISVAKVYIKSSYNNTIMTLTDLKGNVLVSRSTGNLGFKGTKQSTSYAASKVADAMAAIIEKLGIKQVEIIIRGVGSGREAAVRSLGAQGVEINNIRDKTSIPHGGCRPPKARRA